MYELEEDVASLIHIRNIFYKKKYYLALGAYFLSLIVIIVLLAMTYYLLRKPVEPIYFLADKLGRLIPEVPVQLPNMTQEEVSAWLVEAVESANSYDFVNYHEQLQQAQMYFTDYGWQHYMQGLKASNNLLALTRRKLVVSAKVVSKPKLIQQGLLKEAYAWKFEVPLLVTYYAPPYDEKSKFQNPLVLNLVVQRQPLLSSYKGLGIVQMIGSLASAPAKLPTSPLI